MRSKAGGFRRLILPLLILIVRCTMPVHSAQAGDPPHPLAPRTLQSQIQQRANWGAGRCSSTSCHGSPTPVFGSRVFRNEHTVWASRDRHADAYQTLYSDTSRLIARKLGQSSGRLIPAHQDSRCLACHSSAGPAVNPELTATIRQDGVGCESCHGAAEAWLGPHTTYDWDVLTTAQKEVQYGKVPLDDLVRRAERCVTCHVGTPARNGRPAIEVNHDLIAAGHPRLNFEFSSFLANLPAHWVETGRNSAPDFPARAWAIGQLVSARTALELLRSRAAAGSASGQHSSWPEFAEYDCASCHQKFRLTQPRPVNLKAAGKAARPGLPAWGTWYFPMVPTLASASAGPRSDAAAVEACLAQLRAAMGEPIPDAAVVSGEAGAAAQALDRWLGRVRQEPIDPARTESLVRVLRTQGGTPSLTSGPGWDHEAQTYLGLVPLRQSLDGPTRNDPRLLDELRDRRKQLLAPFDPVRVDSIGAFRPTDRIDDR